MSKLWNQLLCHVLLSLNCVLAMHSKPVWICKVFKASIKFLYGIHLIMQNTICWQLRLSPLYCIVTQAALVLYI